mmetsp:Transcript_32021/g.60207  ORF Transcript_32021/g.60207 Transcript_32021/m.60207 type:complete len:80 (+) Transcript_32021:194-433(+)
MLSHAESFGCNKVHMYACSTVAAAQVLSSHIIFQAKVPHKAMFHIGAKLPVQFDILMVINATTSCKQSMCVKNVTCEAA